MDQCTDLTIDDFKDKFEMEGNWLDVLAVVAGKGKEKLTRAMTQTQPSTKRETYDIDDHGEASAASTSKQRKCNLRPLLPEEFEKVIEEMARGKILTPATLVIQKCLFDTDLRPSHNMFSIPMNQIIRHDFLTDGEKRYLYTDPSMKKKKKKIVKKKHIEVKMIEPSLELETVKISRWDMLKSNGGKTSSSYVIDGKWSPIVRRNNLRKDMQVQLWSFRVDQDLCFALVPLQP
ncbi:hypothetical protein C2S52_013481 [Perilla frutescens var. hirtella]|nr:hypothetical protein C2S52_013481 [Perilla frutescens var. hirtella]